MKTIKQAELDAQIESHAKWLKGDGGERLVLIRYDLSGSDLRGSNLSYSNLSYSNLSGIDLRGIDLNYNNLSNAKGFYLLPIQDPRGHPLVRAVECKDGWRIRAGCRDFTIAEAKEHWGPNYKGDRFIGDDYLYAIEWLERKIK